MKQIDCDDYGVSLRVPENWTEQPGDRSGGQVVTGHWKVDERSHIAMATVWKRHALGLSLEEIANDALGTVATSGHVATSREGTTVAGSPGLRQELERTLTAGRKIVEPVVRAVGLGFLVPRASRSRHHLVLVNGAVIVVGVGSTRFGQDEPVLVSILESLHVRPAPAGPRRVDLASGRIALTVPSGWERYPPIPAYASEIARFAGSGGGEPALAIWAHGARGAMAQVIAAEEMGRLVDRGMSAVSEGRGRLGPHDAVVLTYHGPGADDGARVMREYVAVVDDSVIVAGAGSFDWDADGPAIELAVDSIEIRAD